MQVQKTTVESLFTHERRYVIPLFQRPYVWTQKGQWEPLWDDIRELAERELNTIKTDSSGEETAHPHFMGAIVLQQRAAYGDHLPVLDVIDGQQRLTTLQIFLVVLRDVAKAHGDTATAKWATSRTENNNALVDPDMEVHKLWPTQRDKGQFLDVVSAGSPVALEKKHPKKINKRKVERPVMVEAYSFFHDRVDAWVTEPGDDANARSRALRLTIQRRMEIVQIDLDANENPQEIFETLNARGVPLLASDLLRNFVFERAEDPLVLHKKYWARFDEPDDPARPEAPRFWEVEEQQGRLSRARLDLFVQHYLTMKLQQEVRINDLFREYKKWITKQKPFETVEAELQDFVRYADHFHALLRPDTSSALGIFAARLRALDINSVYPLVIGLLGEPNLPEVERDGILADIESFLVRRTVCGRPTKSYTQKFLLLLKDFRSKAVFARTAFRDLLSRETGDVFDWPTDKDFEDKWNTVDAYTVLKPERVEMLLRAIEVKSRSPMSEPFDQEVKYTVEHVMPQDWDPHWPLPPNVPDAVAREAREEMLHDFGNLMLLTGPANSSASNLSAAVKFQKIQELSHLELTNWFVGRTTWTEDDIRERGRALFKTAIAIWPRP